MKLTVPQILMFSHAAKVNGDRLKERMERDRKADTKRREKDRRDPVTKSGKRMSELTMEELLAAQGELSK